jgi:hypothetical protein
MQTKLASLFMIVVNKEIIVEIKSMVCHLQ